VRFILVTFILVTKLLYRCDNPYLIRQFLQPWLAWLPRSAESDWIHFLSQNAMVSTHVAACCTICHLRMVSVRPRGHVVHGEGAWSSNIALAMRPRHDTASRDRHIARVPRGLDTRGIREAVEPRRPSRRKQDHMTLQRLHTNLQRLHAL
jgi:hypothetical protein